MKRPIKKAKRFSGEEGSQVFSEAQEKWLGGADRTDPYILARMRSAVPDEPKVETKPTVIESSEETGNKGVATETHKAVPKPVVKANTPKPAAPKTNYIPNKDETKDNRDVGEKKIVSRPKRKVDLKNGPIKELGSPIKGPKELPKFIKQSDKEARQFNNSIRNQEKEEPEYQGNAMKKGGTVKRSSASNRADGCAIRGKTRA